MFVKFVSADRVPVVVNAAQISFISCVSDGTRIRFGEGRSVTVTEPMDEVIERLNHTQQLPGG
ncbi:flagellar FlbD family protein [Sphingobium aquiterrae]|uniref:flagellar FlbD family protein n=1 Tax=Sphingobium aquiterrae TaxID=2038656 RepID=UPI003018B34B